MKTAGKGCLVKVGANWFCRWVIDGKPRQQRLSDENGNAITDKSQADIAKNKFMLPYRLKNESDKINLLTATAKSFSDSAQLIADKSNPDLLLKNVWQLYIDHPSRNICSIKHLNLYHSFFERFEKWINKDYPDIIRLNQINYIVVEKYCGYLKTVNYSPATYNKHLRFLRTLFDMIKRTCQLSENPFSDSIMQKPMKNENQRKNNFTPEQVKLIIEKATGDNAYLKLLFIIAANTGLRYGDCCNLQWNNIDFEKGIIKVIPAKTARNKQDNIVIPLLQNLKTALEEIPVEKRIGYVMSDIAAKYKNELGSRLNRTIQLYFKHIGIQLTAAKDSIRRMKAPVLYGFHSFRHYFITNCFENNIPADVIQSIVGHSAMRMTEHYNHVSTDRIISAFNGKVKKDNIKAKIKAVIDNIKSDTTGEQIKAELLKLL